MNKMRTEREHSLVRERRSVSCGFCGIKVIPTGFNEGKPLMKTLLPKRWLMALAMASILVLAACGGADAIDTSESASAGDATEETIEEATNEEMDDEEMDDEEMDDEEMDDEEMGDEAGLFLEVSNFPTLDGGLHYEGWVIIDGEAISTGKFIVEGGVAVGLDGETIDGFFIEEDLTTVTTIIVTIEPSGDTDTVPSETKFVAGDLGTDGLSELTIAHPAALGTDFSDASGQFLLATPSSEDNTDEFSGVWFFDPAGPVGTLDLPTLPAGWVYEGWAVIDGVPISTGTFLSAEGADSGEPFKGEAGTPPFPGEDFLTNAPDGFEFPTDLRGMPIVISVEPSPDDSATPFVLKPLVGMAPGDGAAKVLYDLDLNVDGLPTASVRIG